MSLGVNFKWPKIERKQLEAKLQLRNHLAPRLEETWRRHDCPKRVGLAISGGIDSMCMAHLCHKVLKEPYKGYTPRMATFGIIVDHRLRSNSTEEAKQVQTEVKRYTNSTQTLKLDWTPYNDTNGKLPQQHLETLARKLRYEAIAQACVDRQLDMLLLGHHADDQAETVLARLINGYHGFGLRGIRAEAAFPLAHELYGVHQSGKPQDWSEAQSPPSISHRVEPRMLTESGGITVVRPLLALTKYQIEQYAFGARVKWAKDVTNSDPTYALRNTVRYLHKKGSLPVALRKARLREVAQKVAAEERIADERATDAWKRITVDLDPGSGRAAFSLKPSTVLGDVEPTKSLHTELTLMRKLLELVSPIEEISLQDMHKPVEFILPAPDHKSYVNVKTVQVAGAQITRVSQDGELAQYEMHRANPSSKEAIERKLVLDTNAWWQLWDHRYWIRVRPPEPEPESETEHEDVPIAVNFLTPDNLAKLRQSLPRAEREDLDGKLSIAPGTTRFTIPAILVGDDETIVALPSIDWSISSWEREGNAVHDTAKWTWDIRYKQVSLAASSRLAPQRITPPRRKKPEKPPAAPAVVQELKEQMQKQEKTRREKWEEMREEQRVEREEVELRLKRAKEKRAKEGSDPEQMKNPSPDVEGVPKVKRTPVVLEPKAKTRPKAKDEEKDDGGISKRTGAPVVPEPEERPQPKAKGEMTWQEKLKNRLESKERARAREKAEGEETWRDRVEVRFENEHGVERLKTIEEERMEEVRSHEGSAGEAGPQGRVWRWA